MSTSLLFQSFGIRHVKVNRTEYLNGKIVFHAKVKQRLLRCPCCKSWNVIKFGHKIRQIRLIPIGRRPTILKLKTHRVKCCHCGEIRWIKLPFLEGKSNCSRGFIRYLLDLCQLMTIKAVAGILGVGWDLVKDHHKEYLFKKYRRRNWKKIKYLGIDEFSFKKGHKYLTIAVNLQTGEIIYVAEGKSKESIKPLLLKLKRYSGGLKAVALDMNPGYIDAMINYLPGVPIVFDRFHVVKLVNQKLDELRRSIQSKMPACETKTLKGSRYLLLANYADLDDKGKHRIKELIRINEPLNIAYTMKEQLLNLWEMRDKDSAERFLKAWCLDARKSGIPILMKFGVTIAAHRTGILNYFDHPISTGKVEGINNKIKTLKRQVYGFRDMLYFRLRLFHLHKQNYSLTG